MVCSYCKEKRQLTGEHLIPMSLLNLFPECDINYVHDKCFKGDRIVINDVCNICNNETLSELDTYGAKMVKEYFVKTYEATDYLSVQYDFLTLSKWLLKILYNVARSNKIDTTWFEKNLDYILGKTEIPLLHFSIFSGLSIDMNPLPEFFFDNLKLGVYFNPFIVKGSVFEVIESKKLTFKVRDNLEKISFSKLSQSGILRFGSGMFLVFLWDPDIENQEMQNNEEIMLSNYPYTLLKSNSKTAELKRVTHAFNYHNYTIIDTTSGMYIADQTNCFLPYYINPMSEREKESEDWNQHVKKIRENRETRRKLEREKRKRKRKR